MRQIVAGHREDSLHDAGHDTAGRAPSVLFEIELSLPGKGRFSL
ncbi:hypothetical protein ACWCQB_27810 [Streptomyces hirsutus]